MHALTIHGVRKRRTESHDKTYELGSGTRVRCITRSAGQGREPVVALSGLMVPPDVWNPVAGRLSGYMDIYAFENLGQGMTRMGRAKQHDYLRANAELVRMAMDHLGIKQAHFICQSMGGHTFRHIYRQEPTLVKSAVLASTPLIDPHLSCTFAEDRLLAVLVGIAARLSCHAPAYLDELKQGEAISSLIKRRIGRIPRERLKRAGFTPRSLAALARYFQETSLSVTAEAYISMRKDRRVEDIPLFECPLLYIGGEHDAITRPETIRKYLRETNPHATVTIVPDAGHSAYATHPAEFVDIVLNFYGKYGVGQERHMGIVQAV